MKNAAILALCTALVGCGVAYQSPSVREETTVAGLKVRVLPMTAENVLAANRSAYTPAILPAAFSQTAGTGGGARPAAPVPDAVFEAQSRPAGPETILPPQPPARPYTIGIGDVLLLATPRESSTVAELSGLLAAQNTRQGYTVQDDGSIAIPNVGRVEVVGLSLDEAEAALFQRLVESRIEPAFSLEIAEFGSRKATIGGAVASPAVVPIGLTPLKLQEALQIAGGVTATDIDYAVVRLYRDGRLYQIPVAELYSQASLQGIQLVDGDSLFVDTTFDLNAAQAFFEQQITLAQFQAGSRSQALSELQAQVAIRSGELSQQRSNFEARLEYGAEKRDYVYLSGEVAKQGRVALPYNQTASLADTLYQGNGFSTNTANPSQIYVLRGSDHPAEYFGLTAYQLDMRNAANLLVATRFEMRPNDVIFIAEQPVTRWNRVITQITPSLFTQVIAAASN